MRYPYAGRAAVAVFDLSATRVYIFRVLEKLFSDNLAGASPHLAGVVLYPVKGLDGVAVESACLMPSGALEYDRRWKIVDAATGDKVNGKREPKIYTLRAEFDLPNLALRLRAEDAAEFETFCVRDEPAPRGRLEGWLSDYFGRGVTLMEDAERGFPDDPKRPGPTLISQATLEQVAGWFAGLTPAELLRRMRANMVIGGVAAFWEDSLYAADEASSGGARLAFGNDPEPLLEAVNPCLRCIVPTRDSHTGEATDDFAVRFMKRRLDTLPGDVPQERFEKPFRLAVNTVPASARPGSIIRVGDRTTATRKAAPSFTTL